jgi:hypothetical protein
MSSDFERLRSRVRRYRRQAFLARFANGVPFCFLLGLTAIVLTRGGRALEILAIAGAAALGAALVGVRSLSEIARDVDRKAGLDQRLETAFELQEDPDPVSRLVVRDAVRAIEGIQGADVFPIRIASDRWTLAAFAFLTIALLRAALPTGTPGSGFRPVSAPAASLDSPASTLADTPGTSGSEVSGEISEGKSPEREIDPPTPKATSASREDAAPAGERNEGTARAREEAPSAEWISIERPLDSPLDPGSSTGVAGESAAGAGGSIDGGAEGERGGGAAAPSVPSGSSDLAPPSGGGAELPVARDRIPPGLRDYVRAYFARLGGPR